MGTQPPCLSQAVLNTFLAPLLPTSRVQQHQCVLAARCTPVPPSTRPSWCQGSGGELTARPQGRGDRVSRGAQDRASGQVVVMRLLALL